MSVKNLSDFRNKKGLTQEKMSKKLDISISFYKKVETGIRNPSYNFITKFKKVFPDADVEKLFFKKVS